MLLKPELFITAILMDNSLEDLIHDTIHEDEQVKGIIKKLEEGETMKTWLMEDGLLYFQCHELSKAQTGYITRRTNLGAGLLSC
jgi:hypothetical protein